MVYRFRALSRSSDLLFFVSAFSLICKHFRHNFEQLAIGFDVYLFPAVHSGLGFPHHFGSIKALGMLLCHIFGNKQLPDTVRKIVQYTEQKALNYVLHTGQYFPLRR